MNVPSGLAPSLLVLLAALRPDPKFAFLLLCVLFLAAGVPLAIGWARIVPPDEPEERRPQDPWAVVLLALVTISYAAELPGLPRERLQHALFSLLPGAWRESAAFAAGVLGIVLPGVAAVYAALWRSAAESPLRWPLLLAGLGVTLVWLAAPYLTPAWLGP